MQNLDSTISQGDLDGNRDVRLSDRAGQVNKILETPGTQRKKARGRGGLCEIPRTATNRSRPSPENDSESATRRTYFGE